MNASNLAANGDRFGKRGSHRGHPVPWSSTTTVAELLNPAEQQWESTSRPDWRLQPHWVGPGCRCAIDPHGGQRVQYWRCSTDIPSAALLGRQKKTRRHPADRGRCSDTPRPWRHPPKTVSNPRYHCEVHHFTGWATGGCRNDNGKALFAAAPPWMASRGDARPRSTIADDWLDRRHRSTEVNTPTS